MNTGQVPLMTLMSAGATPSITTPATSTALVPAGDQIPGDGFAALLLGTSSQAVGQQANGTGATKTGSLTMSDIPGEAQVTPQSDAQAADMLAMLLMPVGDGSQSLAPSSDVTAKKGTSEEPAESKQPDAAQQSQDVALYTAGMLNLLPLQMNGRMPEPAEIGQVADDAVTSMPAVGAMTAAGAGKAAQLDASGQVEMPAQQQAASGVPGWQPGTGVSGGLSAQPPRVASPSDDVVQMAAQPAGYTVSAQAAPLQTDALETAPQQPIVSQQPQTAQQQLQIVQQQPQAAPQQAVQTTQPPQTTNAPLGEPMPLQVVALRLDQPLQTAAVQSGTENAGPQAAVDTPDATDTTPASASGSPEKASTPASTTVPEGGASLPKASPAPVNTAAGTLTGVNVATTTATSENSGQARVDETGGETVKPHEMAVQYPSTPEIARTGNQQRVVSSLENRPDMVEGNTKAGVVPQSAKAQEGTADGANSGTTGEKSEGFMPKSAETPTGVTPQMTGGHQALFAQTQTSGTAAPQPAQADVSAPVGHEQIAGQVREQLASHDLKPGSDQITFKLSPDHLGDIKVNLSLEDQRLKVEIVAENKTARDSLLQHADSLKESLARQNISVEKFDVTTGGGSTGGQSNGNAQTGAWSELAKNRQSQQWFSAGAYRTPQVEALPSSPMYQASTEHAMVDLHF